MLSHSARWARSIIFSCLMLLLQNIFNVFIYYRLEFRKYFHNNTPVNLSKSNNQTFWFGIWKIKVLFWLLNLETVLILENSLLSVEIDIGLAPQNSQPLQIKIKLRFPYSSATIILQAFVNVETRWTRIIISVKPIMFKHSPREMVI